MPQNPPTGGGFSWHLWFPLVLLLLALLLLYGQTVTFPFVNWDDTRYVYRNPVLLYPTKFSWWDRWFPPFFGYPLPLTLASYRIDQMLYGVPTAKSFDLSQGWGYHITNLILWIMIIGILYRWCLRFVRSRWAVFAGVAVFAFHPVSVETVAWVTGRKELLLTLFSLCALGMLHRWGQEPKKSSMWALLLWSLAALLSKPNAVFLLPFGLWYVLVFAPHNLKDTERRSLWRQSAVVAGVLSIFSGTSIYLGMVWQSHMGAVETSRSLPNILDRALWAFGYHLRLFFYPIGLRIKYIVGPNGFDIYHGLGLLGLTLFLFLLLHPRTRRSPAGVGSALFLTSYLPVSNLMPLRRYIADTYLFLPMIGIALIVAYGFQQLQKHWSAAINRGAMLSFLLLLLGWMGLTWKQIRVWKDAPSLWENVSRYHPNSPRLCRMLGNSYNKTKQLKKAVTVYQRCIKRFGPAMYRNNLAITYLLLGQWRKARHQFRSILQNRPGDRKARYYLQMIHLRYPKKRIHRPRSRPAPSSQEKQHHNH